MEQPYTDEEEEELSKYAYAIAKEWADWPCAILTGIGQLFLLNTDIQNKLFFLQIHIQNRFFTWNFHIHKIIIFFILAEIIWFFTAEHIVSFKLAYNFRLVRALGFVTSPVVAIILFTKAHIWTGILALIWPWFLIAISFVLFMILSLFCDFLYGLNPPRMEIMQIKMKAQMVHLSPEETDYFVNMAKQMLREAEKDKKEALENQESHEFQEIEKEPDETEGEKP